MTREGIAISEGAFLKRDNADALYVTNAREIKLNDNYCAVKSGALTRIYPTDKMLLTYKSSGDELSDTLKSMASAPICKAARALFIEGVKLLEAPDAARIALLERKLRMAAAVALRKDGGGGLWQCALVLSDIRRRIKI